VYSAHAALESKNRFRVKCWRFLESSEEFPALSQDRSDSRGASHEQT